MFVQYIYKIQRPVSIYNVFLQHKSPYMTCKLHPKFIPNEASKDIKILKDLAVETNQK